jgi:hypothetical protein
MTVICCVVAFAAILFLAARFVPQSAAWFRASTARPGSGNVGTFRPLPTSARWLEVECSRLASADASWEAILASVNPGHDVEIGTLLARIRASHTREPRVGLMAIQGGCRLATEQNDMAIAFDGLTAAARSLPPLPVVHW